jgi:hypothetical protein
MINRKIGIIAAYFFQFLILLYTIFSLWQRQYITFFAGIISLFITFLPLIIKRRFDISLPWFLNFCIVFALYLNLAGEYMGWYLTYAPVYDKFGHFFGSVTVALLSFAYVAVIERYSKVNLDRFNTFIFIIIFTMALGGLWEIMEFTSDQLFHTIAQPGLVDTMYDLIFDLIGGIFVATLSYINFDKMKEKIITIGDSEK